MSKGDSTPANDNNKPENIGSPPAYPPPVHQDAGPVNQASPYNAYGGFSNPSYSYAPSQSHLDPRDGGNFSSPAPGGFHSPMPPQGYQSQGFQSLGPYGPYGPPVPQQGFYGPPGPQQNMYYGPQPGPGPYGPPPGGYYMGPNQGYRGYSQYERDRGAGDGICAGIFGALACCCCLDLLF